MLTEQQFTYLEKHPDYRLLKRVPEHFSAKVATAQPCFYAAIVDLETMGLDPMQEEIIELGMLTFCFNNHDGILEIVDCYNELNDPKRPIPPEITNITGITDNDVKGKFIDWAHVHTQLQKTHLIICHNSGFDRNFLEQQTPKNIQSLIKQMPFGCTIKDINWRERGYESAKLDYLNFKLGFFYDGHRALNDCFATFNLLVQEADAFEELKSNVRKKETLVICQNAPFEKKELLKQKNYRWSDGQRGLPKAWWTTLTNDQLEQELSWLDEVIYGYQGAAKRLPKVEINARKRYSIRAQCLETT